MEYQGKSILELRKMLDEGQCSSEELFQAAKDLAYQKQEDYNSFVTILDQYKKKGVKETLLTGIPYALKDNFSTRGILTTASSHILEDYVPVYDATVYKKLKDAGAVLVGKTVLDELAMGGNGITGHTGVVRNPWDKTRMIGGSSAGSAASVASGIVPFAIGSDTGDSVRKPASHGGIVGFKPTYGRISRYGMFAFASSLDHVGIFARNVEDVAIVTDILKGPDPHDMTSLEDDGKSYQKELKQDITGRKLFYIKEICDLENYQNPDAELTQILTSFHEMIEQYRKAGIFIKGVSFDRALLEAIYPTYMAISCAEATSNNANLTGIAFGPRGYGDSVEEIMFSARTKGFSEFIKRRFILGSYILQKENQEKLFLNACRIRRLIVDKMTELFQDYDGLILPATGSIPAKFGAKSDQLSDKYLLLENHMAIGNFGGFPSITIPYTLVEGMPIGFNITGRVMEDDVVLAIAHRLEAVTRFQDRIGGDQPCMK